MSLFGIIPIEEHSMSVFSAILFMGVFFIGGLCMWWIRREVSDIDAELATHTLRLNDAQKEVSALSVEIGKISVIVENTEKMTGQLMTHILK